MIAISVASLVASLLAWGGLFFLGERVLKLEHWSHEPRAAEPVKDDAPPPKTERSPRSRRKKSDRGGVKIAKIAWVSP